MSNLVNYLFGYLRRGSGGKQNHIASSHGSSESSTTPITNQKNISNRRHSSSSISRLKLKRTVSERDEEENEYSEKKVKAPTPKLNQPQILEHLQKNTIKRIGDRLVALSSSLCLDENAKENLCFLGYGVLQISLSKYVERLVSIANSWADDVPGPESTGIRCSLFALHFMQKCKIKINNYSVHRLFATAFLIGLKSYEDYKVSNGFFAKVFGISLFELNVMESEMVDLLNWNLYVSEEQYAEYRQELVATLG